MLFAQRIHFRFLCYNISFGIKQANRYQFIIFLSIYIYYISDNKYACVTQNWRKLFTNVIFKFLEIIKFECNVEISKCHNC